MRAVEVVEAALDRHVEEYAARRRDDPPSNSNCAQTALVALTQAGFAVLRADDVVSLLAHVDDHDNVPADVTEALVQMDRAQPSRGLLTPVASGPIQHPTGALTTGCRACGGIGFVQYDSLDADWCPGCSGTGRQRA